MSTEIVSDGAEFEIIHLDRAMGGRQRSVLRVDGRSGDIEVSGTMRVNGTDVATGPSNQHDHFDATSGQTSFELMATPTSVVKMFVNGMWQQFGVDFTVSGRTVTRIDYSFQLEDGDLVDFEYLR